MLRLILELRARYGIIPTVVMPRVTPEYAEWNIGKECAEYNIECISIRYYWFKNKRCLKSFLCCMANIFCYPMAYLRLRHGGYDMVHSNGSVISIGAYISRWMKVPHVWHLREFGSLGIGMASLLGRKYESWIYSKADVLIAISNAVVEYYGRIVNKGKIRLVYNGIMVPASVNRSCTPHGVVRFCLVGLLTEQKNQMEALQAVNVLVNERGITNFHLTLIGKGMSDYATALHSYMKERGLSSYVTFLGERSDVNALLDEMDVGLMLSYNEAFGRVTVEYMMHGMAVIASDSGANCEIVEDGQTGLIYRLGDCHDLSLKMQMLIDDRDKTVAFGTKGRNRALALFTSGHNARQVYDVYKELYHQSYK